MPRSGDWFAGSDLMLASLEGLFGDDTREGEKRELQDEEGDEEGEEEEEDAEGDEETEDEEL